MQYVVWKWGDLRVCDSACVEYMHTIACVCVCVCSACLLERSAFRRGRLVHHEAKPIQLALTSLRSTLIIHHSYKNIVIDISIPPPPFSIALSLFPFMSLAQSFPPQSPVPSASKHTGEIAITRQI